jgi:flavin-dependent dehydrogenase
MPDQRVPEVDVLIVGARVAGATLALQLGMRGHRVMLIDRSRFPSDTLSTHYMAPSAVSLLDQLGVLGDVEAHGFRRVTRSRATVGPCAFEGPISPDGSYGLAPRRDILDAILVDHAVRRGQVTFCDRTRATGLIEREGRICGARISMGGDRTVDVNARIVVGADGRASNVAAWAGAASYREQPALRPVYYGYFRDVAPLPEPSLEQFYIDNRVGFLFPMQPGIDCLALELQPDDFPTFRAGPLDAFMALFRTYPYMQSRLANAMIDGKLLGVRGIPNHFRVPFGPGWALTGDAAYLKDPLTGTGIADAINQSIWLARALGDVLNGADWHATLAQYHRHRDEMMEPMYRITLESVRRRDPSLGELAWLEAALCSPAFARILAARLPDAIPDAFPDNLTARIETLADGFAAAAGTDAVRTTV